MTPSTAPDTARTAGHQPRVGLHAADLVAAGMVVAALVVAVRSAAGLLGPFDPDQFRDIAQIQVARGGHPLSDPYYAGEWLWYNPLLSWIVAVASRVGRDGVEPLYMALGPWLNLGGPIGFYLVGRALIGPTGAAAALAGYLFFVTGDWPAWATSTYSPWLFVGGFSLGLFFAALLVFLWAERRPATGRGLVAGMALGAVFLAHTAAAAILALMAAVRWSRRGYRPLLPGAVAASVLVASPFLYSLVVVYHGRVQNWPPVLWQYPPLSWPAIWHLPIRFVVLGAVGLAGAIAVPSRLLTIWLLCAALFLLNALAGVVPFVPAFHFAVYVMGALLLFAGRLLARYVRPAMLLAGVVAAVLLYWPAYVSRRDIEEGRRYSRDRTRAELAAVTRLAASTDPDAVVLASDRVVERLVGPAGRRTVALNPLYASPYVDAQARMNDRTRMLDALRAGDRAAFQVLGRKYGVTDVALDDPEVCVALATLFPDTRSVGRGVCLAHTVTPQALN